MQISRGLSRAGIWRTKNGQVRNGGVDTAASNDGEWIRDGGTEGVVGDQQTAQREYWQLFSKSCRCRPSPACVHRCSIE